MRIFSLRTVRSTLVATTGLSAAMLFSGEASAAITVTQASVSGGKLTLRGTAAPRSVLTLDGGVAATRARASGAFDFGYLPYIPGRCIVKVTSPGQPTVVVNIANCAPITLVPRGAWDNATSYMTDELVFHDGSTWRARQPVPSQLPPPA